MFLLEHAHVLVVTMKNDVDYSSTTEIRERGVDQYEPSLLKWIWKHTISAVVTSLNFWSTMCMHFYVKLDARLNRPNAFENKPNVFHTKFSKQDKIAQFAYSSTPPLHRSERICTPSTRALTIHNLPPLTIQDAPLLNPRCFIFTKRRMRYRKEQTS